MAMTVQARRLAMPEWLSVASASAAAAPAERVLASLGSSLDGLSSAEAQQRLEVAGPNALRSHGAQPFAVLARQLRNPLLTLLLGAALTSFLVGERLDALIIFLISGLSIGLGFFNEYRSERAVEALHSQLRHTALLVRNGKAQRVDVTDLVPGDVVRIEVGDVVPADLRLLQAEGLECDEAVLTGESLPAEKQGEPITAPESPLDLASCALMGTVVRSGSGLGVVVQTGGRTAFGAMLAPDTELIRRRAAGETFRELAPDYGVSHTTLSRYFARPEVGKQLKRAEQLQRAEQRAAETRFRAEQKAERERAARRRARQPPPPVSEALRRQDGSANAGRGRSTPPLELEPFTDEWLAWYEARRLFSSIDMLNDNDARRGIMPPRPGARAPTRDFPACESRAAFAAFGCLSPNPPTLSRIQRDADRLVRHPSPALPRTNLAR